MDIQKIQNRLRLKGIQVKQDDSAFHLVALNEIVLNGIVNRYNSERGSILRSQIDLDAMRAILLDKGVRVAPDDPIFICMAVNEIVLEDIAERCRKQLSTVDKLFFTIKQPGLRSYLKVVFPLCLLSAGAVLIDHDLVRQGLAVLLGGAIGVALSLFYLDRLERHGESPLGKGHTSTQALPSRSGTWTEAKFDQAAQKALDGGKIISNRTLKACKAVLVQGERIDEAAGKEGIRTSQVRYALGLIQYDRQPGK
ncbi:hypothetical protein [Massilia sp. PWRC2]|uniref:hypothetical protein n=1 Tax=Massilia sp. PWRC2 TaxID=2804626 RepID=UPI003CF7BA6D